MIINERFPQYIYRIETPEKTVAVTSRRSLRDFVREQPSRENLRVHRVPLTNFERVHPTG